MRFTAIEPSEHYLEHHLHEVPWEEAVRLILQTKNPRKKGENYEIETKDRYLLFTIKDETLILINAKRTTP